MMNPVNQNVRLIACPTLSLEHGKIDRYVPEGETVAGHLRAIGWQPDGLHARVFIDGHFIEKAQWEHAVPRAGQSFVTRVIPGEGGGKDALRIVAMLGIVALAIALPFTSPFIGLGLGVGTLGGALLSASLSILGSLRANSLIPARRR